MSAALLRCASFRQRRISFWLKPVSRFTKHIFLGSERVCSVNSQTGQPADRQTIYHHNDHLGSTNLITNENGYIVQECEYTPYGQVAQNTGTYNSPFKFTGKELDDQTELYYYGARYYDPVLCHFTQADTMVVHPHDPQDYNRYSYCRNNPLIYIDPTGHGWFSKFFKKAAKFFKEKVLPAAIAFVIAASITIATGGMGTHWAIIGASAALTTLTLDTGEGRQLIRRVAHEFFDDVLGMRPSTAHTFGSIATHMAVNWAYTVGLNAMFGPDGLLKGSGAEEIDKAAKSGQTQHALDTGKSIGQKMAAADEVARATIRPQMTANTIGQAEQIAKNLQLKQILDVTAQTFGVAGAACMVAAAHGCVPAALPGMVFLSIAALAKGLSVSLYSATPYRDIAVEGVKMATGTKTGDASIVSDGIIDIIYSRGKKGK